MSSIDRQIALLRDVVSAETDMELAEKLGLQRSAISKWRKREAIPAQYLELLIRSTAGDIGRAMLDAHRIQLFGRLDRSLLLRIALAVLPPAAFADVDETPEARGRRIEQLVMRVVGLAVTATNRELGRDYCENEEDADRIVRALRERQADAIHDLVRRSVDRPK